MLRNLQRFEKRKSRIKGRAGAFESMSHNKLNVKDEYAKMYEDAEKRRNKDYQIHSKKKKDFAKKHSKARTFK